MNKKLTVKKQTPKYLKGDVFSSKCPSRDILNHITSKWGVLILAALSDGEIKRFSELRDKIDGISEKMLTQTLRTLEEDGLLKRTSYPVVPPYVEYSLSNLGMQLAKQVIELVSWIEANVMKIHK